MLHHIHTISTHERYTIKYDIQQIYAVLSSLIR